MSTPTIGTASVGGRGVDPDLLDQISDLRTAPTAHVMEKTDVVEYEPSPTPGLTPREAYDIRVKRLREAGVEHTADPKTLTVTYVTRAGAWTTTTTLRYREPS